MQRLRRLTEADLGSIAQIHIRAFPKSALTMLGVAAVRRYYHWLLTGPHDARAIGMTPSSGTLASFCFGGVFRGALSGFLRQNRGLLAWRLLSRPWLLFHPIVLHRIWTAFGILARFRMANPYVHSQDAQRSFGILAIAVDPRFDGQGLGTVMMQEAEKVARQQGFSRMDLTVEVNNTRALRFYERQGWRRRVAPGGEWQVQMIKELL